MKKTFLALAVAAVATSAHAKIDLYKDDTKKVTVKGEVDVYLNIVDEVKSEDASEVKDDDFNVSTWAQVEFGFEHQINDDLKGFASFEVDYSDSDAVFDDVYAGVTGSFGTLKGGETGDSLSVVGNLTDITNEGTYAYDSNIESKGKGIRYEKTLGGLYVSADLQTTSAEDSDDEINVGASYSFDYVTFAAAYSDGGEDVSSSAFGASLSVSDFYLAALYSVYEGGYAQVGSGFGEGEVYGLAASYSFNDFRFYASTAFDSEDDTDNRGDSKTVGLDYTVNGDITLFAEYTGASYDVNDKDADTLLAGVYYAF
ncbi:porin [Vibrio fluminensis]|uniref:porin n=1 Tax=Vibrio fluminensis TaxID=2783614 RepID=UPI001887E127|nr:porin [Vibrio fluminensis]